MTDSISKKKQNRPKEKVKIELSESPKQDELDFDESEFEILSDQRKGGKRVVSLNPKLGRLVLYKAIYQEMVREWGSDFDSALILVVSRIPGKFWIRPCSEDTNGKKKIHKTGETRMLSAKMLITRLNLDIQETAQYPAEWDQKHNALMVDVSARE